MVGGVTSVDDRLAVWIATHRYSPVNDLFVWLGTIDKLGAAWVALALIVAVVRWRRPLPVVAAAVVAALVTFVADAASFGVKDLTHRTRPFEAHPQIDPLYVVHSSSFPSGHAATSFAGAMVVSYLAPRSAPFCVALAALIGFSRVYDGVHYPGDVIVGAGIGVAVGLVGVALIRLVRRVERGTIERLVRRRPDVVARNG
jgi:undecaprenyl-diphosphatase